MPPPLNSQTVIAFIWDFDKTLSPGYMQDPLFEEYGVSASAFWTEVNSLVGHYADRGLLVSKDTAYLGHLLSYSDGGPFEGLTNARLRELGARISFAPGIPDFMTAMKTVVSDVERYREHGIEVENYIVSTGLRQMIEGSAVRPFVDGVWACELLSDPPGAGYLAEESAGHGSERLTQIGYTLDNTTKTRAVFEINKGSNVDQQLDVNARMDPDDRRVPFRNMIYVADGPSDVPVFSVVSSKGGHTLGVWTDERNYSNVMRLQQDGRVMSIAKADFQEGSEAYMWLKTTLTSIADGICDARDRRLAGIAAPGGHVM